MAHNATVCFAKINHLQDNLRLKRDHNIPVIHRISNQSWNQNKQNSHFSEVPSKWSFWLLFKIAFILFNCKNLSSSVSLNKCYFCLLSVFKTHVHFSEVFLPTTFLEKSKMWIAYNATVCFYKTIWGQRGITIFQLYIESVIKVEIKTEFTFTLM